MTQFGVVPSAYSSTEFKLVAYTGGAAYHDDNKRMATTDWQPPGKYPGPVSHQPSQWAGHEL
jgi:hypothetical protein